MGPIQRSTVVTLVFLVLDLMLLAGCGGNSIPSPLPNEPGPLDRRNVNLIFVVSEDLAYHEAGDVNASTANLTNRGLQRALRMTTFLQQSVLGSNNVTSIYALAPMTHLQTADQYPDMVPLETVEQLAMLNQTTLWVDKFAAVSAASFPLNVSYSTAAVPDGVATPLVQCPSASGLPRYSCQGLDFRDLEGANETLVGQIIQANVAGFYVFSAPWETVRSLMTKINQIEGYDLAVPTTYAGPNVIYAIAIPSSGNATLLTYDSQVDPPASYPTLPAGGIVGAACLPATTNTQFHVQVTGGIGGAVVPAGINTNETVYLVRHGEAHPTSWWEDGNTYGAGQWRALELPNALRGKIHPTQVYSIDPAQVLPGASSAGGEFYSYVRTNTTVLPYAIANNLPYNLAASFEILAQNPPALSTAASDFFFTGGRFSGQSLLVGWEHDHIPSTVNALLAMYHGGQKVSDWPGDDYDTVWTVRLDANGNVSVDNVTCEGISSSQLPKSAPVF